MSNRSAKFISAIFASILAGANFAAVAENSAKTTDDCLSSPKGAIPAGHHWYYRTEHPSKRQCWYSREESDRSARAAPQESISSPASQAPSSLAAAIPVPPPLSPTVRKSIADARAELIPSQMRIEQDPVTAEPRASAAAAAASFQNNQRAPHRCAVIVRRVALAGFFGPESSGQSPPGFSRTGSKPAK
jgi:hypothetical protein